MHQIGHKVALLVMPAVSAPGILLSKNMARLNPRPADLSIETGGGK